MLKLAVFDLDGTLKRERDPFTFLHRRLGTLQAADAFTARGLSGEISYEEWLRLDTGLWQGVSRRTLQSHLRDNPYLPGVRETVSALKAQGVVVAIISSGLLFHAEMVAEELGIGLVYANEVSFSGEGDDAVVDGRVRVHVPYAAKGPIIERLQAELGIGPEETLAAGDTRSDLALFERARWAVAVQPDHADVAAAAHLVLPTGDFAGFFTVLQNGYGEPKSVMK